MKIIGNNSAGIKAKSDSFKNVLNQLKPGVVMLQETKLYRKGTLKFDNFCVFEKVRGQNEGGGLLTLVHQNFEPIMLSREETKGSENILIVEAKINKMKVRFLNAYGPQETCSIEDKTDFYSSLDQEIQDCLNLNIY